MVRWMETGWLKPNSGRCSRQCAAVSFTPQHRAAGSTLGIGYATPIQLEGDLRIGVVPVGFWDGLNHVPPLGDVLVNGRRARLVGAPLVPAYRHRHHPYPEGNNGKCGDDNGPRRRGGHNYR